jgi:hypothetical protein
MNVVFEEMEKILLKKYESNKISKQHYQVNLELLLSLKKFEKKNLTLIDKNNNINYRRLEEIKEINSIYRNKEYTSSNFNFWKITVNEYKKKYKEFIDEKFFHNLFHLMKDMIIISNTALKVVNRHSAFYADGSDYCYIYNDLFIYLNYSFVIYYYVILSEFGEVNVTKLIETIKEYLILLDVIQNISDFYQNKKRYTLFIEKINNTINDKVMENFHQIVRVKK